MLAFSSLISSRISSFKYAFTGIVTLLRTQRNARIHALATLGVVTLGFALDLSNTDWCILVLAMVSVWMAEALNTAVEFLSDRVSPDFHPLVKKAKDVAAGAVLIAAIGAVFLAVLVLGPYLI